MSIVLFVFFLLMDGKLLSMNSQVIKYHAHFVSSRDPPAVWSTCSQLLAIVYRFLHTFCSELSFKLVACSLFSSTNPMMWIIYDTEWSGDVMSKPVHIFPTVSIMGVLSNNRVVPAHPDLWKDDWWDRWIYNFPDFFFVSLTYIFWRAVNHRHSRSAVPWSNSSPNFV